MTVILVISLILPLTRALAPPLPLPRAAPLAGAGSPHGYVAALVVPTGHAVQPLSVAPVSPMAYATVPWYPAAHEHAPAVPTYPSCSRAHATGAQSVEVVPLPGGAHLPGRHATQPASDP